MTSHPCTGGWRRTARAWWRAISPTGTSPPPSTFPHQGWVHNNGLTVVAPGLPEAEVTSDGIIYVSVVRAVGWLSRIDLNSRTEPAGPGLRTPDAQCLGRTVARLALAFGPVPQVEASDGELGLRAVPAGPDPVLTPGQSLVSLDGPGVVLTALKPAEHGSAFVARVLNPTDQPAEAVLRCNLPVGDVSPVRLDEEPAVADDASVQILGDNGLRLTIPPHALRSVKLEGPLPG